jgi:class 3 adenylate cyclase
VRAARIEPITPPGQVYASQQFAALASTQRVQGFTCEYVGRIPLPKHAGVIPLYLVRARTRDAKRMRIPGNEVPIHYLCLPKNIRP